MAQTMLNRIQKQVGNNLRKPFSKSFQIWLNRRIPAADVVRLNHKNIVILPSTLGVIFFFVLALMFVAAINYESSLGFALVFMLLSMFLLTILYTFRNLADLSFTATDNDVVNGIVFADSVATFIITVEKHTRRFHESIQVSYRKGSSAKVDLIDDKQQSINIHVRSIKRGILHPGRLRVETVFPFGLVRAWSYIDLNVQCLVCPRPLACDLDWLLSSNADSGQLNLQTGNDDFYGLRDYRPEDSLRHIAWKQYARGRGLFTKQYSSNVDERIWLSWEMFDNVSIEERLSRLCYCVLELDGRNVDYGLRLPEIEIEPAKGAVHYLKVLKVLALYGLDDAYGSKKMNEVAT